MSSRDRTDTPDMLRPPEVVRVHAAGHIGPAFDGVRDACKEVVQRPHGPHHLTHFSGGVYDFEADVLDLVEQPGSQTTERLRARCQHTGRQLSLALGDLGETMQKLKSGALIRAVLHTGEGACCCYWVVPRQCIIGVVFDRSSTRSPSIPLPLLPTIGECDESMGELVTGQRARLSLGSQNPGGFSSRKPTGDDYATRRHDTGATNRSLPAHIEHRTHSPAAGQDHPSGTDPIAGRISAQQLDSIQAECQRFADPADLNYVAYYQDGSPLLSVDHLDDHELSKFFTQVTTRERRALYLEFGQFLGAQASRLARMTAPTIGRALLRLVLDFEQGAIYHYRLQVGGYMVGVTLDQAQVTNADDKMAELALRCQTLLTAAEGA